jgi:hypothetical protein
VGPWEAGKEGALKGRQWSIQSIAIIDKDCKCSFHYLTWSPVSLALTQWNDNKEQWVTEARTEWVKQVRSKKIEKVLITQQDQTEKSVPQTKRHSPNNNIQDHKVDLLPYSI